MGVMCVCAAVLQYCEIEKDNQIFFITIYM